MKTDYSYKLVATIIVFGVFVALVSPSLNDSSTGRGNADNAPTTAHTE